MMENVSVALEVPLSVYIISPYFGDLSYFEKIFLFRLSDFSYKLYILYISLFGISDHHTKYQEFPSPYLEKEISLFCFSDVSHMYEILCFYMVFEIVHTSYPDTASKQPMQIKSMSNNRI